MVGGTGKFGGDSIKQLKISRGGYIGHDRLPITHPILKRRSRVGVPGFLETLLGTPLEL